ncbi:ATP-binding cassette domain-containing protein [Fructilactobacillus florum]|uniref:Cobalt import ATP-binding protein cbiO 2 n=1 Tax=Fructilactobacillus florum DSM 22689 = JCM 16035 TaxID=1423745 RepID=A0A0R2CHU4_9LACO|nr:ATP-binding cassette domain-containing protein [Fructilactobacillus florum]KRM91208.1 cobalt import ATP-binding protein cbiO 2 [Fructilactobacillus florum DSM 22689 = JCM 16035]
MDFPVVLKQVNYSYGLQTPVVHPALTDISLQIAQGETVAIVGATGSGKSTLMRLLNGLQFATSGTVTINGLRLNRHTNRRALQQLRSEVGMIFQAPEHQLFAETVLADVSFGPQNFGKSEKEARQLAQQALRAVGIPPEFETRSPFELSGGQMRRVAIAGVLAMKPRLLVLDEPTVGLDAAGVQQLLDLLGRLQQQQVTIIIITHDMDVVAQLAARVLMLQAGQLIRDQPVREFFATAPTAVPLPAAVQFYYRLQAHGVQLAQLPLTATEATRLLVNDIHQGGHPCNK